jgi:protein-tyrosine phosphatase
MVASPYWITPTLAIVPRPRGGDWLDDEMVALREAGINVVVSMLEETEAAEVALEREEAAARGAGLQFVNFVIPDRSVPINVKEFEAFLNGLEQELSAGRRVGVHCRACIGRASVTTASLLIRSGVPAAEAWQQVATARGFPVPDTREQREWVDGHMRLKPQ